MDSQNRGIIQNRNRSRQINDFRNMRFFRNITPTDIDGAVEIGGKIFIFFELKYGDKQLDFGQMLFLERTVDNLNKTSKAMAIHARHEESNWENDIDVASCYVVKYYSVSKKWIRCIKNITVKQLCDRFISKYG